jgi:hypothetical protein
VDKGMVDMVTAHATPRFPLSCRLYVSDRSFQQRGSAFTLTFFKNPVSQLQKELVDLSRNDTLAFAALVVLMVCDGCIPFDKLYDIRQKKQTSSEGLFPKLSRICCWREADERNLTDIIKVKYQIFTLHLLFTQVNF